MEYFLNYRQCSLVAGLGGLRLHHLLRRSVVLCYYLLTCFFNLHFILHVKLLSGKR